MKALINEIDANPEALHVVIWDNHTQHSWYTSWL